MDAHKRIALAGSLPLLVLPFLAGDANANYRFSWIFLLPILWGACLARRRLDLHPLHFALFTAALVLHDFGALGGYTSGFQGVAFDTYVHFLFGLAGGLIVERSLRRVLRLSPWQAGAGAVLVVLGLGAIHEIFEVATTIALGPKHGMYKLANPDELDTQKDLGCNLLGALLAIACAAGVRRAASSASTADPRDIAGSPISGGARSAASSGTREEARDRTGSRSGGSARSDASSGRAAGAHEAAAPRSVEPSEEAG